MSKIITHRCEGSLENNISIRYTKAYKNILKNEDYKTWRLFQLEYDEYFDNHYLKHVAPINICPFCGEKLDETKIDNKFNKHKEFIENSIFEILEIKSLLYNCVSTSSNIGLKGEVLDFNEDEPFTFYSGKKDKTIQSGLIKDFKLEDNLLTIDATYYKYVLKIIKDLD